MAEPLWIEIARRELASGVVELPGNVHNPRIVEYLSSTTVGKWARHRDETPWCAAFVNWCLQQAGQQVTRSASARKWLPYGTALAAPEVGALVVLTRPGSEASGHIGFVVGHTRDTIAVLGGNQGNRVSVRDYDARRLMGYRWPVAV